jgi:hypothetical protein
VGGSGSVATRAGLTWDIDMAIAAALEFCFPRGMRGVSGQKAWRGGRSVRRVLSCPTLLGRRSRDEDESGQGPPVSGREGALSTGRSRRVSALGDDDGPHSPTSSSRKGAITSWLSLGSSTLRGTLSGVVAHHRWRGSVQVIRGRGWVSWMSPPAELEVAARSSRLDQKRILIATGCLSASK